MTDIPEHLLARSRARRSAIGGGDGEAGDAPAAAAASSGGGESTAVAAPPVAAAPVEAPPPPPPPPYVQAALARPRIPRYAMGALAALPLWGFIYFGTLVPKAPEQDPQLALGADVYAANCASCHGASGGGASGPALDEVVTVFPERGDHVAWVVEGSVGRPRGQAYGDPAAGRTVQLGAMPGFGERLSPEEIDAVVRYEREEFGGEAPAAAPAGGNAAEGADDRPGANARESTEAGGGDDTADAERSGGDVGGDAGTDSQDD